MEYYDEEWKSTYASWIHKLCRRNEVYRAIIKATLADKGTNTNLNI